jgi:hydrogenase maturation protein HypF
VSDHSKSGFVCQRIRLSGVVQGVGLRPLAMRLAKELKLSGWVRNDAHGVEIEACGKQENVERLIERLHKDAPPLARIDAIKSSMSDSVSFSEEFFILDSRGGRAATMVAQDTAVCRSCLSDMFDPEGRRWRYAFTSCVHCGPRYSISRGLPFERARTSLKPFVMCNKCQAEYRRPEDKRLLAEGNCCPKCGPQLSLLDANGELIVGDAIAAAYALLKAGKILAIKGQGGFHLACDAHNPAAVALLRERKSRKLKPLPVMLPNALSATTYVQLSVGEPGLLNLPERPIILLRKRGQCDTALPSVAPGIAWLGVMLPSSPTHYLLFHEAAGRPAGTDWLDKAQGFALVMISANRNREPSIIDNAQAVEKLAGIADAFLVNDCEIVTRCDDSIAYAGYGGFQLIRRARGYAPRAVKLLNAGPPILAVGGPTKNAVCLTRGDEAFVSQHLGQLTTPAACECFEETVMHLMKMLEVSPSVIAYDHHRDSHPTRFALELARQRGIPTLGVQHHHAHIASVLAEHHVSGPIVALSLDGGEIGADGKIWGGGNCCVSMACVSSDSGILRRSNCRAATMTRVRPGVWPRRFSMSWAVVTKLSGVLPISRRLVLCQNNCILAVIA